MGTRVSGLAVPRLEVPEGYCDKETHQDEHDQDA